MQRRIAIKNILSFCGGVWVLNSVPGCKVNDAPKPGKFKLTENELALLSDVSDTIIPPTDTPGAKELGIHLFVLTMIRDCFNEEQQKAFVSGLNKLNSYTRQKTGADFSNADMLQRKELLESILKEKESTDLQSFAANTKNLTIKGYETSEYFMTNLVVYKMIPGHFYGCVKIEKK